MGWKQHIRLENLSIGRRIFWAIAMVILLTTLLFAFSASVLMRHQLLQKAQNEAGKNLVLVSEKLDIYTSVVQKDALTILTSAPCQALLGGGYDFHSENGTEQYRMYRLMWEMTSLVMNFDTSYDALMVYDLRGNPYVQNEIQVETEAMEAHQEWVRQMMTEESNNSWMLLHKSPLASRSSRQPGDCISYFHKVFSQSSGRLIGLVELSVSNAQFVSLYAALLEGDSRIFFLDQWGMVTSTAIQEDLYHSVSGESWYQHMHPAIVGGEELLLYENKGDLYLGKQYEPLDCLIVGIIPAASYMGDVRMVITTMLLISLLLLAAATYFSRKLILSITRPISTVTQTIKKIGKGDYTQRVHIQDSGEMQVLAEEINRMADKTNHLMQQIITTEQRKREFQLSLVQMQMTPHFFYNILESVCGLILMDEKKTAIQTLQHLSQFYRGVLHKGKDIIEISKELAIAESYLQIMEICHPGTFAYEINCPAHLGHYHINKLTLQPILENAIHHGMEGHKGIGHIKITVGEEEERIYLRVEDDGKGLPAEIIQAASCGHFIPAQMDNFGLRNTQERIQMYFGSNHGLVIESEEGRGTSIIIWLPKRWEGHNVSSVGGR